MSDAYEPIMKNLIKTVMRTFYEPHHAIIADLLLENMLLSDAEFCSKMKMLNREFNKLIVKLKDENLLKHDIKVETKEDGKQIIKTVFFFNYAEFRDIVKYKIYKMTKTLELKHKSSEEIFYCKDCDKKFTALEAQANMEDFIFKCIFCKNELVEYSVTEIEKGIDLKKLLNSIEPIVNLLKQSENYQIPKLDYFQILERKKEKDIQNQNSIETQEIKNGDTNTVELKKTDFEDDFEDLNEFSKKPKISDENKKANNFEMVYVNGVLKPISDITEEDKSNMTEEEYLNFFEIFSKNR